MHKKFNISNLLFNEDYDVQRKLLNSIVLAAIFGVICALITQIAMGWDTFSIFLMGFALVLFSFVLFVANILNHPQGATVILALFANNFLLPIFFVRCGGVHSGMPLWCLAGCTLSFLLLKGKKTYVVFFINVLGFIGIVLYSYYFPEIMHYMDTEKDVVVDVAITVIIVTFILSTVLRYNTIISERQNKKLEEAKDIANQADKAKSEFLSMMSHDIRTPMNTIIGFTEIAKQNLDNTEKLKACLERITISSNHLLSLVNDVIDVSKIESGKLQMNEENCSLKSIIDNICQIMQAQCIEKNIRIRTDYSMLEDDNVSCNKLRLNQILINIVNNAIKYSKRDGKVDISVIQFTAENDSQIICEFHIKDEGCGMSPEFLNRVTMPFEREQTELNKTIAGSGLGLSITKSLTEMMNGSINFESKLNEGTEVVITIPFSVPSLIEFEEEEDLIPNFGNYRVLLVDDNEEHREIIVNTLSEVGLKIDEASEGKLAINKLLAKKPGYYDLILMDIVMPVMDGYEATREIRKLDNSKLADIPIVAMTANAYAQDKAKAFESGMDAYVTKPIDKKEFLKVLKLILHEKRND